MQRMLTTLALLGCLIATPVTANSISVLLQPSPAAIVLVAGKWLTTEREKVYKVRVQCTGVNEKSARNNCFAKAINDAVGSVVVSDSETSGTGIDRDLTYHELLNYSSGWVHDYEILSKENTANNVQLTMNVSVQGNAVADRAFGNSRSTGELDSNRISTLFESYQEENAAGDKLIDSMLRGFPHQAFAVKLGKADYTIDANRDMILSINFSVAWDKNYVNAMEDVLEYTGRNVADATFWTQLKTRASSKNGTYHRFDNIRGNLILQGLTAPGPQLLLSFGKYTAGCYNVPELSGLTQGSNVPVTKMIQPSGNGVTINSWLELQSSITIKLDAAQLNELGNPKLAVVNQRQCL